MSSRMPKRDAAFDGLARSYEKVRPRYPRELFAHAVELVPPGDHWLVVDAGAGTGIGLDALVPLLPAQHTVHAVDISSDMVDVGRSKYPGVTWHVGEVEPYLESLSGVDLVLTAQAYQWLDRPRFLRAAGQALTHAGVCMVVENNRDHASGGFLDEYETLLETYSPGYTRSYREIDVAAEMAPVFARVEQRELAWERVMSVEDFITMSSSSTQAQRAVTAIGEVFFDHLRELCQRYEKDGDVRVPYRSQAFYGINT
jgi:SAM-dependent methyltransferase